MSSSIEGWNETRFLTLLEKLIGETESLQNKPPTLIPKESVICQHVEKVLEPFNQKNGGPLKVERIEYTPGRGNLIVTYPGSTDKVVSFVGSHMDVVPANRSEWSRDPFKLVREGDQLFGRGTTDCLGHVALLTNLFCHLAETKPKLAVTVVAVFIANEENSEILDIGVDGLVKNGAISHLKNGWMYWVDSADKHPAIGSGTLLAYTLTAKGRLGHSGLPHVAINALMLAYEALMEIMRRFHEDFPAHPLEKEYGYPISSTMKPTMWSHPDGAMNQIPGQASISGDIRATPFYDWKVIKSKVEGYVADVNANITKLRTNGPHYSYQVSDATGSIEFEWKEDVCRGIACDLKSPGFLALKQASLDVLGSCNPISITGSLPCVAELQEEGFDLQMCGYGVARVYHGIDEYCNLSDMIQGYQIFQKIIVLLNESVKI